MTATLFMDHSHVQKLQRIRITGSLAADFVILKPWADHYILVVRVPIVEPTHGDHPCNWTQIKGGKFGFCQNPDLSASVRLA
jgi:hypothetical protein